MFLELCWFKPVPKGSCPSDPKNLKKCTVPTTKGELCEAGKLASGKWPSGTGPIDNCGYNDVYFTECKGTDLVSNSYMT